LGEAESATHALPSEREGNRTALAPWSNRSAAILWRDRTSAGGDLVQVEVLQAMLKQQREVAILQLLARRQIGQDKMLGGG